MHATRGITAGSGTATAELRLLILALLDVLDVQCPQVRLAIYVDDINVEATRPNHDDDDVQHCHKDKAPSMAPAEKKFIAACELAGLISKAVNLIVAFFEDEMRMEVSAEQSRITSSIPALARMSQAMVKGGKAKAICHKKGERAKMLGVETNGGISRVTKTQTKRRAAVKKRTWRYHVLGSKGFSRTALARATVVPATTYGCEVVGYSDSALGKLRRVALATVASSTAGGHMDAEWAARDGASGKLDPAFAAHAQPIVTLAEAWWSHWRSHDALRAAHVCVTSTLRRKAASKRSPWSLVTGPTAAAVITAARLGWSFESADVIITDDNQRIELGADPPAAVRVAV